MCSRPGKSILNLQRQFSCYLFRIECSTMKLSCINLFYSVMNKRSIRYFLHTSINRIGLCDWWRQTMQFTVHVQTGLAMFELRAAVNPLNTELNPICHLMALLGAHHILHISRIGFKLALQYWQCLEKNFKQCVIICWAGVKDILRIWCVVDRAS